MGVGAEAAETAAVIAAARYEYAECRRHDRFDVVVKGLKHDEIAGRHAPEQPATQRSSRRGRIICAITL